MLESDGVFSERTDALKKLDVAIRRAEHALGQLPDSGTLLFTLAFTGRGSLRAELQFRDRKIVYYGKPLLNADKILKVEVARFVPVAYLFLLTGTCSLAVEFIELPERFSVEAARKVTQIIESTIKHA